MHRPSGIVVVVDADAFSSTSGYVQVAELASGGMGRVDLCLRRQGAFERLYAVKRLHPHFREDDEMRTMFLDEARVAGLLRHAHVVSVLDVGEDDDGPFLVMDYVEGVSLSQFLRHHAEQDERTPPALCGSIVSQIARGLHAAHELVGSEGAPLELVHRDVSPQNVLVGRDGLVRVTDFGISKALGRSSRTSTGLLKGKAGYMSPEQLRFESIDRRSDLFALGIVFYELVTCSRLYRGKDANLVARRILTEPPPDVGAHCPQLPPAAVELCFRLLAKDPEARPETAAEVADTLDEAFALDEAVDLAAYVEARFQDQLAARRSEVQESISKVRRFEAHAAEPVSEPRTRRGPWIAGALVGAATLAVAGLSAAWESTPEETSTPAAEAAEKPSKTVSLKVESRPPGADVRIGDEARGQTPLSVDVARGEEAVVVVSLEGYESQSYTIEGRADERLVVTLAQAAKEAVEVAPAVEAAPEVEPSEPARPRRKRKRNRTRKPTAESTPSKPRFRKFE